jgi:hypothetical protein
LDAVEANAANGVTVNIIDNTPRGLLLTNSAVSAAIESTAQGIYVAQGMTDTAATIAAQSFLYGSTAVSAGERGSIATSLWGEASSEFASSLSGNITVIGIALQANSLRTFATVEIPALLDNPNVTSVGGVAISALQNAGSNAFAEVFTGFQNAIANGGLYALADGTSRALTQQALDSLGFTSAAGQTAAELAASGLDAVVTSAAESVAADLLSIAGKGGAVVPWRSGRRGYCQPAHLFHSGECGRRRVASAAIRLLRSPGFSSRSRERDPKLERQHHD